jgi:hypothetical protein
MQGPLILNLPLGFHKKAGFAHLRAKFRLESCES